jgi:signal transduction histidine kinase
LALKGYLELSHEEINNPATLIDYLQKEETAAATIEHQIMFTKEYEDLGIKAPEWQNVHESVARAKESLSLRGVTVKTDGPALEVFADPLITKVFYNLMDNAVRHGGEKITTIRFSSAECGSDYCIICEDDGIGIPAEQKQKIFERGYGKNTGLGLFLAREILSITGITIIENGIPGKGARFEIMVPKGEYRLARTQ